MRTLASALVILLMATVPALAQSNWFQPAVLERPDVKKALQSVDERSSAIVEEWSRLVEVPPPSRPAVAIGATLEHMPHRLEETAEASSIVPGIKSLITLAVALTSHR